MTGLGNFARRIGQRSGATRAPRERKDAKRHGAGGPLIPPALFAFSSWLALALILLLVAITSACTGTANWDITPPPEGTWPFDRFGNYDEAYADGRHPDADLYWQLRKQGLDILEVSLRGANPPGP